MAKNITLMGANYSDVPAVDLPQTGGGTARFSDASVTTATASDVAQGKIFLDSQGQTRTGTATQEQADWDETDPTAPSYIQNKPTIPSKTSDLTNDSGYLTSSDVQEITSAQITSIIATIDTTGGWSRASGVNF